MKKKIVLVEVEWEDIVSDDKWMSTKRARELTPATAITWGVLYQRTKKEIKVVGTLAKELVDPIGQITVIPRKNVVKIRYLKYK